MLVEHRRDLVRLRIIHRPHRPNHRMESSKLHCRRKMDHLVWTAFIPDRRMTRRQVRKFGILQVAPDNPLDRKVTIMERKCGFERLLLIWETVTG